MANEKKPKHWTAAGSARAARQARIATADYLRGAPIARTWEAQKLLVDFQLKVKHIGDEISAALVLFTGMGYPPTWRPGNWVDAAEKILTDEARYLTEADLYILSPQMCDVVIAAAKTLTWDDLNLITADDLPSPSGLIVLPHPILVSAVTGDLADLRAFLWRTPIQLPTPDPAINDWTTQPAVRTSTYHDSYGPVRPDSFVEFAAQANAEGHPLPPLLLDAIRCIPFERTVTEDQRRAFGEFVDLAQQTGHKTRAWSRDQGRDEERVVGEHVPGSEIQDVDSTFAARFLYAFWRLCDQRIATTDHAEVRHSARVAAQRAGTSPEVRVVQLRLRGQPSTAATNNNDSRWRHRWVVRMHKVRHWYPSEQRHKVIYRGPYIKGPDDKPLIGGETVRGLVR